MNDKTIKVRMPEATYNLAQVRIGRGNMSAFVREAIDTYIKGGDTPEQIIKEIEQKKQEIQVLQAKLDKIEEEGQIVQNWKEERQNGYNKACHAITRMSNRLGYIGRNQLEVYSNTWHCRLEDLEQYCKQQEITVTNYGDYTNEM